MLYIQFFKISESDNMFSIIINNIRCHITYPFKNIALPLTLENKLVTLVSPDQSDQYLGKIFLMFQGFLSFIFFVLFLVSRDSKFFDNLIFVKIRL